MIILGFIWLALLLVELVSGLHPWLQSLAMVIWIIFILDFLFKFTLWPAERVCMPSKERWPLRTAWTLTAKHSGGQPCFWLQSGPSIGPKLRKASCYASYYRFKGLQFGLFHRYAATFFIGSDAESKQGEIAGSQSVDALREEITALREDLRRMGL
ncbi:MAG: hypothetical protein ACRD1R_19830 [Acidobacteriota bacterium]